MPQTSLPARPARDLEEPTDLRVGIRPGAALRVVRRHGPQLALDLAGVTFLDCAGVNVLLATRRRARLEDGWIRVTQASPRARRTISLLGLQKAFALSDSVPP